MRARGAGRGGAARVGGVARGGAAGRGCAEARALSGAGLPGRPARGGACAEPSCVALGHFWAAHLSVSTAPPHPGPPQAAAER